MKTSRFDISIMAALVVSAFMVYSNSFHASFQMDDDINIVSNNDVHMEVLGWEGILRAGFSGSEGPIFGRSAALATFALNYYFGGLEVFGYHLVNIIIHILSGIGIYFMVRMIAGPAEGETAGDDTGLGKETAALAALSWLVSPVQTQAVTYIVQRMTSMATLFYIWAFVFYLKGRRSATTKGRVLYFSLTLLFFLLAIVTKEIGLTFPVMMLLYEFCFHREDLRKAFEKKVVWVGVFAFSILIAGAFYLLRENLWLDILLKTDFAMKERIYTEARIVVFYTFLLLFPIPSKMALFHDFEFSRGIIHPAVTLPALLFVGAALALSFYRIRRDPLVSFFTLWYLTTILPESLYPGIYPIFEHRLYLPSVGFFTVSGILLARFWMALGNRMKPVLGIALIFIYLMFSANTYGRNKAWHDPISLWTDNVRKAPLIPKPHEILGMAYLMDGRLDDAERELKEALNLDPLSPAGLGIGIIHYIRGDYERAFKEFDYARRLKAVGVGVRHIDESEFFYKTGQDLIEAGRVRDARRIFELGLDFNPDNRQIREALIRLDGR